MKLPFALFVLPALIAALGAAQTPDWMATKARAEELYAQGSFELARRAYATIDAQRLAPEDQRWLEFRLNDTRWRAAAGAQNADSTELDEGRKGLEEMQRRLVRLEERDRTWALIEESLGDWSWQRRNGRDYGSAFPHYQNALQWWAGARDVETARRRYLDITFRMGWPDGGKGDSGWWYGQVPVDVAQNAVKIAESANDKAQAEFLLGTVLRHRGDYDSRARMFEALTSVVARGRGTRFHDDALFRLAQALEQQGEPKVAEDGSWTSAPDYVAALTLYRQLQSEYKKGDSAWWDEARDGIRRILRTEVGLGVGGIFLPGSEIGYSLSWRNAPKVEITVFPCDFTAHVDLSGKDRGRNTWVDSIDTSTLEPRLRLTHDTKDDGKHVPGQAELRLDPALPPGAYLLEARAGDARAREILLVSRTSVLMKAVGDTVLAWVSDALTSEPVAGAKVVLFARSYSGGTWTWRRFEKSSGQDGTALFQLARGTSHELFVAARAEDKQAFAAGGSSDNTTPSGVWRIYAMTDRSTYKPNDEVQWKLIARTSDGGAWTTPKGAELEYEVFDPRGSSFQKGKAKLSDFGSAFGVFAPDDKAPLGEYRVTFKHKDQHVANATLFRLEEYKLPEYEVSVRPATDDGKPKRYIVGDKVEVDVTAAFYSGGPVADADVEIVVKQNSYWRQWSTVRDYPWFYEDQDNQHWNHRWGGGQVIKQEKFKTDAQGRVRVTFDTPRDLQQDFEFTIEARVTDASRREISGSGSVRVTRREYDVRLTTPRNLQRPGDKVEIAVEAQDANSNPVAAQGTVRVTRERWVEVWIDPAGNEVSGGALDALRRHGVPFPPTTGPRERPWRWKSAGYVGEEVAQSAVKLGPDGKGSFTFMPQRSGYYRARWTSKDARGRPVEGETWTFCVDEDTRELGFQSQGLEIVADKDTFKAGEKAPVMITTAASNRYVLVTLEGQKLHSYQVVQVLGTAKLVLLDITQDHVPNVWITASSSQDGQRLSATQEVVVPPTEQFLDVVVKSDRDPVRPGSKAVLDLEIKNHKGEPVEAEVALALVDEAVASIQGDYAGDVRQYFYGEKKPYRVQTHSTFDQRAYRKFVLDEKGGVIDERHVRTERDGNEWRYDGPRVAEESLGAVGYGGRFKDEAGTGRSLRRMSKSNMPPAAMSAMEADASDGFFPGNKLVAGNANDRQDAGPAGDMGEITVRSDFRETALWNPTLKTGADGRARVEVQYPDSLTRWKASARVIDAGTQVGTAATTIRAQKPLVARLQAPRFFTVGDETVVSGVIGNRTDAAITATVDMVIEGGLECPNTAQRSISIPAQGELRLDWTTRAVKAGDVRITLRAKSADDSDAMTRTYMVQDHGIEVQVARTLKLTDAELIATLEIPAQRTRETTRFTVDVAPSIAVTMLDALPYLVEYPYGCTEQTMSRFLPAAIVAHTLRSRGLSPEDAMQRVFGGIEPETAGKTHPGGKKALTQLDEVTRLALERLYDFQHSDGGWGWWKDGDSDKWMSAYVVWGLSLARDAGLDIKLDVLERGASYLSLEIVEAERDPDLAAWMLHALAASGRGADDERTQVAFAKLWEQKNSLRAYGKALFALAAHGLKKSDEARLLCQNLANGAVIDAHPDQSKIGAAGQTGHAQALGTVHWGSDRGWWRWQDGAIESTAFALRALATIDPENTLVAQASNWLVQNRRGAQWSNTRDTAFSILALDAFLNATGELARDVEYELVVNGEHIVTQRLKASDMLTAPARFVIPPDKVVDGRNEVRLKRLSGKGPLYLAARAVFFSREDKITARGSDMFVKRQYWKMVPRSTLLAGVVYDRVPLEDGGEVVSGERVEVVLTIETKNDFEYLMFEDLKPAGLEAVAVRSGERSTAREIKSGEVARRFGNAQALANAPDDRDPARFTGRQRGLHQELRERYVALFIDRLGQGIWEVRYELRAEVPGRFSALPTMGYAMYVPELRCNGDEIKLTVRDRVE